MSERDCPTCGTTFARDKTYCSRACYWQSGQLRASLSTRLWRRVDKSGSCWLWTGATTNNGYGVIGRGRRSDGNILTHVASYLELVGPIPEGWQVDHLCRVRACCNPAHLEAVTQQENLRRQWADMKAERSA